MNKRASEIVSSLKKKFKSIFSVFETFEEKDDEEKMEGFKNSFKLRTFIHGLYGKLSKQKDKPEDNI